MAAAKTGDAVRIHYRGSLADGTEFDNSEGRDPIAFTIGDGSIIPGFESAVVGMSEGETKRFIVGADEAYGPHHEDLIYTIDREAVPPDMELEQGMRLQVSGPDERPVAVTVTEVCDECVTLDANHPLAGRDLHFEIQLVEIV